MDLNDVYLFVRDKIAINYSGGDDKLINDFLQTLNNRSLTFSARLLICIGIDIKTYEKKFGASVQLEGLVNNYKKIILFTYDIAIPITFKHKPIPPHIRFALSLNQIDIINCKPSIGRNGGEEYTKIATFFSYMRHIVSKNILGNPSFPSDIDPHSIMRYYRYFVKEIQYTEVNVSQLSSSNGWVFVADKRELQPAFDSGNTDFIINSIGYYIDQILPEDKYVYLSYPIDFDEEALQPTALTGDWGNITLAGEKKTGNHFFLSYRKQDDWGRTYSVSGTLPEIKERTHLEFNHGNAKFYNFKVGNLNNLTSPIPRASDDKILDDGIVRFEFA